MSKLRRQRAFGGGEIQSGLSTAGAPQTRAVEAPSIPERPDYLDAAQLPTDLDIGDVRDRIVRGDSAEVLSRFPAGWLSLAVTSPPYWNLVDYGVEGQIGAGESYDAYRGGLAQVWAQVARCLRPNGKLAINVPLLPLSKQVSGEAFGKTHTRMILDLYADLKADVLATTDLRLFSVYIWEKQTTEKMFGSYPHPPNLYERNTIEFVAVFVKPGPPPKLPPAVKVAAKLTSPEWMELTKQIWWMYPANVSRREGHPAPFPEALPNRLINLYTFPRVEPEDFPGDVVLDPFAGWGTTCVAARRLGRPTLGIELSPGFAQEAAQRLASTPLDPQVMPAVRPSA